MVLAMTVLMDKVEEALAEIEAGMEGDIKTVITTYEGSKLVRKTVRRKNRATRSQVHSRD